MFCQSACCFLDDDQSRSPRDTYSDSLRDTTSFESNLSLGSNHSNIEIGFHRHLFNFSDFLRIFDKVCMLFIRMICFTQFP